MELGRVELQVAEIGLSKRTGEKLEGRLKKKRRGVSTGAKIPLGPWRTALTLWREPTVINLSSSDSREVGEGEMHSKGSILMEQMKHLSSPPFGWQNCQFTAYGILQAWPKRDGHLCSPATSPEEHFVLMLYYRTYLGGMSEGDIRWTVSCCKVSLGLQPGDCLEGGERQFLCSGLLCHAQTLQWKKKIDWKRKSGKAEGDESETKVETLVEGYFKCWSWPNNWVKKPPHSMRSERHRDRWGGGEILLSENFIGYEAWTTNRRTNASLREDEVE